MRRRSPDDSRRVMTAARHKHPAAAQSARQPPPQLQRARQSQRIGRRGAGQARRSSVSPRPEHKTSRSEAEIHNAPRLLVKWLLPESTLDLESGREIITQQKASGMRASRTSASPSSLGACSIVSSSGRRPFPTSVCIAEADAKRSRAASASTWPKSRHRLVNQEQNLTQAI